VSSSRRRLLSVRSRIAKDEKRAIYFLLRRCCQGRARCRQDPLRGVDLLALSPMPWVLEAVGGDSPSMWLLPNKKYVLGRGDDCDIKLSRCCLSRL